MLENVLTDEIKILRFQLMNLLFKHQTECSSVTILIQCNFRKARSQTMIRRDHVPPSFSSYVISARLDSATPVAELKYEEYAAIYFLANSILQLC